MSSLGDWIRCLPDAEVADLLAARPDLLTPLPSDLGQLAVRAATRTSVNRVLDRLDRWTLQVLETLVALPSPPTCSALPVATGADPGATARAVAALRRVALVWGPDDDLVLVPAAAELLGRYPGGLGPTVADALAAYASERRVGLAADLGVLDPTAVLSDPAWVRSALASAPDPAREVVALLAQGSPVGQVAGAERMVRIDQARSPVEWLLARGLLVATGPDTVVLPREVGLVARDGQVLVRPDTDPPELTGPVRDQADADQMAAGSASELVRQVARLLDVWAEQPPELLRGGRLGVRETRATARRLAVDEPTVALLAELARTAGLLAISPGAQPAVLPTARYDSWLDAPVASRWLVLVQAWRGMSRVPALVGTRQRDDSPITIFDPQAELADAPELRAAVLQALAAGAPGITPTGEAVLARVAWLAPRRWRGARPAVAEATLTEAAALGLTGLGMLSTPGRSLLDDREQAAEAMLAGLLPAEVDHLLLQADLTAVAPGPLARGPARRVGMLADVESEGAATVYRFTPTSLRRAFDAGWSAREVHVALAALSRTPVPQPLSYLVDDVARRHGQLRVGTAEAYLRCEDPQLLDELVADRRVEPLGLRRLAPTVVACDAAVDVVLSTLRGLGHAPVAEGHGGEVLVARHPAPRAARQPTGPGTAPTAPRVLTAAVRALRAGDRAVRGRPHSALGGDPRVPRPDGAPRSSTHRTLRLLDRAVSAGRPLWIGVVDPHGTTTERIVDPIRVDAGVLTAYDHRTDTVATFPVHRITGVATVDDDAG